LPAAWRASGLQDSSIIWILALLAWLFIKYFVNFLLLPGKILSTGSLAASVYIGKSHKIKASATSELKNLRLYFLHAENQPSTLLRTFSSNPESNGLSTRDHVLLYSDNKSVCLKVTKKPGVW
jgi:hypothetical protein